jgi:hypothetical protein
MSEHEKDIEDAWTVVDEENAKRIAQASERVQPYLRRALAGMTNVARGVEECMRVFSSSHQPGCRCPKENHEPCSPALAMGVANGLMGLISVVGVANTSQLLKEIAVAAEATGIRGGRAVGSSLFFERKRPRKRAATKRGKR